MDLFEESRGERFIEEYLMGDFARQTYKSPFELDQQFAKPIEDEDLFAGPIDPQDVLCNDSEQDLLSTDDNSKVEERGPFANIGQNDDDSRSKNAFIGLYKDAEFTDRENQDMSTFCPTKMKPVNLDEIFINDYSDASQEGNEITTNRKGYGSIDRSASLGDQTNSSANNKQLTPGQLRAIELKQKIKDQLLAKNIKPIKVQPDSEGMIEVGQQLGVPMSNSSTKFMFSKFLNKPKKSKNPLHGDNGLKWSEYKGALIKKIHADKRKIWDSFQAPADNYDEEEEIVGSEAIDSDNGDDVDVDESQDNDGDEVDEIVHEDQEETNSNQSNVTRPQARVRKIVESDDEDEQDINDDDEKKSGSISDCESGNFEDLEKEDIGDDDENMNVDDESDRNDSESYFDDDDDDE